MDENNEPEIESNWSTGQTIWVVKHEHPDEGTLILSPYADEASAKEAIRQTVIDDYTDALELDPLFFEDAWQQGYVESPNGFGFNWSNVTVGGIDVFESYWAELWTILKDPG